VSRWCRGGEQNTASRVCVAGGINFYHRESSSSRKERRKSGSQSVTSPICTQTKQLKRVVKKRHQHRRPLAFYRVAFFIFMNVFSQVIMTLMLRVTCNLMWRICFCLLLLLRTARAVITINNNCRERGGGHGRTEAAGGAEAAPDKMSVCHRQSMAQKLIPI
jgi:hypothetical protein